jgi:16S rRNA (uracil1498-N3)-methyltransferase
VGGGGAARVSSHRVLVEPGFLIAAATVTLDDEEANHLRVRRAEVGATVQLFDGAGVMATGVLAKAGKGWQATVAQVEHHPAESALILAVGAGDRDRFLALAEKCTELGVTQLVPLVTERSNQVETRLRESGVERCRKRAREACKQSGNPWATVVSDLTRIDALADTHPGVRWFLADPVGIRVPREHGPSDLLPPTSIGWLIGPEGGFTDGEAEMMRTNLSALSVQLTTHVMRFETAAVVAAGVFRSQG